MNPALGRNFDRARGAPRAIEILEKVAAHPRWPGYGRIAAEVDLARLAGE